MSAGARKKQFAALPVLAAMLVVAFAAASSARAQTLNAAWRTVDSGGGLSAFGVNTLSGTLGQPDAGPPLLSATYRIDGGFWPGARALLSRQIFCDGFGTGTTAAWSSVQPLAPGRAPLELAWSEGLAVVALPASP